MGRSGKSPVRLLLFTRGHCPLCEEAKAEVRTLFGTDLPIEEIDVDADPQLAEKYGEEVPVGFLGGEKASYKEAEEKGGRHRSSPPVKPGAGRSLLKTA